MRYLRSLKQQYEINLLQRISVLLRVSSPLLSGLALLLPAPYNELSLVLLTVAHWVILVRMSEYCELLEERHLLTSAQQSLQLYRASAQRKASPPQP